MLIGRASIVACWTNILLQFRFGYFNPKVGIMTKY